MGRGTEAAASPGDELVEVLGPDGTVIDVVTRNRMRSDGLAHRSTFIVTVLVPSGMAGEIDGCDADLVNEWFADLTWPVLDPGSSARIELAPPGLRPAQALQPDSVLFVHRRADWKDVYPGYWDLAFGGVCSVGEQWLESAERELTEESGLSTRTVAIADNENPVPVLPIAAGHYRDESSETFAALFVAFTDRDPEPSDGEVVAINRIPLGEVTSWMSGTLLCPDTKALVTPVLSALMSPSGRSR